MILVCKIKIPTVFHLSVSYLSSKIYNLKLRISRLLSKILALDSRFYQKITSAPATAG